MKVRKLILTFWVAFLQTDREFAKHFVLKLWALDISLFFVKIQRVNEILQMSQNNFDFSYQQFVNSLNCFKLEACTTWLSKIFYWSESRILLNCYFCQFKKDAAGVVFLAVLVNSDQFTGSTPLCAGALCYQLTLEICNDMYCTLWKWRLQNFKVALILEIVILMDRAFQ